MKRSKSNRKSDFAASRRNFLGKVGSGAAALSLPAFIKPVEANSRGTASISPTVATVDPDPDRIQKALKCRSDAAAMAASRPVVQHVSNGDDDRYPNKIASYTKALPHNSLGEVDPAAYATLVKARTTLDPNDFENIQLGLGRKLTSPQAGLAMDLEGPDSHHVTLPPPPRFDSAEAAGEAVELYWMALARDVNFNDYNNSSIIAAASAELSRMSDFRGPRDEVRSTATSSVPVSLAEATGRSRSVNVGGRRFSAGVTPATIFRGALPGVLEGPWLSQFLTLDFNFGAVGVSQKIKTVQSNLNFMTNYSRWLEVQNGSDPSADIVYDSTPRYIRNLRDLAQWVHIDALYQAYLHACLIMIGQNTGIDSGLPLYDSKAQAGFAQCGGPHILSMVTEVATRALKAVWYQKWFVHHRLRPEVYGGRVHNQSIGAASYPLHADVLNSRAVQEVYSKYGSYLMPQAFPEGSPTHSSYGSGHATVAGACVTVLKAFFDETDVVKNPMVVNSDGTGLIPYNGAPLTIRGELNKVGLNVAFGRNAAGIHWRSDAMNSLTLGESVAIGILQEQKLTYNDNVEMTFTKFDGTQITI